MTAKMKIRNWMLLMKKSVKAASVFWFLTF